jgi:hypothetical protein
VGEATFLRLRTMSVTSSTTPGRLENSCCTPAMHGGDGGAFQRGKEDAAEGVADGVAVSTFVEGLGDELGVGIGGGNERV